MAEVKPHPLPYTKVHIPLSPLTIGRSTRTTSRSERCRPTHLKQCLKSLVQRPVSFLEYSPLTNSSSITSSLISRSLGYADVSPENPHPQQQPQDPTAPGVGLMSEETLYSVFKQSTSGLRTARQEADKLKAINSTGRVDFVIQVSPSYLIDSFVGRII